MLGKHVIRWTPYIELRETALGEVTEYQHYLRDPPDYVFPSMNTEAQAASETSCFIKKLINDGKSKRKKD